MGCRTKDYECCVTLEGRRDNEPWVCVLFGLLQTNGPTESSQRRLVARDENGGVKLSVVLADISEWRSFSPTEHTVELNVRFRRKGCSRSRFHTFRAQNTVADQLRRLDSVVVSLLQDVENQAEMQRNEEIARANSAAKRPPWDRADVRQAPNTMFDPSRGSRDRQNAVSQSSAAKPPKVLQVTSQSAEKTQKSSWGGTIQAKNFYGRNIADVEAARNESQIAPSKEIGKAPARPERSRSLKAPVASGRDGLRATRKRAVAMKILPEAVSEGNLDQDQIAEQKSIYEDACKRPKRRHQEQSIPVEQNRTSASGILNLGNTCYLGATLQALLGNFSFVYELDRLAVCVGGGLHIPSNSLYLPLLELARDIRHKRWGNRTKKRRLAIDTESIMKAMAAKSDFRVGVEQDAQEFFITTLGILKSEFGLAVMSAGGDPTVIPSAVDRSFNTVIETTLTCESCAAATTPKRELHFTLGLDIPHDFDETAQNTRRQPCIQSLNLDQIRQRITGNSTFDLVKEYFKDEKIEYKCEFCNTGAVAIAAKRIKMLPRILVLHLKRFTHESSKVKKISTPISVPFVMDLASLTSAATVPPQLYEYEELESKLKRLSSKKKAESGVVDVDHEMTENEKLSQIRKMSNCATQDDKYLRSILQALDSNVDATIEYITCISGPKPEEFQTLSVVDALSEPKTSGPLEAKFYLTSYVHHQGKSSSTGHYSADVLESGSWVRYDDSSVTQLVASPHYQAEIEKDGYLLFYAHERYHRIT